MTATKAEDHLAIEIWDDGHKELGSWLGSMDSIRHTELVKCLRHTEKWGHRSTLAWYRLTIETENRVDMRRVLINPDVLREFMQYELDDKCIRQD